ncbi:GtrA family protein [Rhodovulum marinum]|uniref:GtrA-like protein n=1 Tax=Rhodovulum marinum TaxID=320662 RepID=A0A4R2Q1U1_9RHOB|nr:GtrA family protein [Rhodovulum marinum]TCP42369.1 GtrA-like protein [Rhodovulum marinum]
MNERGVIGQVVRIAEMGVVNSALYFLLATLFSAVFGFAALAASVLAYVIAAAVAYFGHKFLTFGQPAHAVDEMSRFVVATGTGVSLAALLPIVLAGFAPMVSFVTVLVLVPIFSFLMMKFFVFHT